MRKRKFHIPFSNSGHISNKVVDVSVPDTRISDFTISGEMTQSMLFYVEKNKTLEVFNSLIGIKFLVGRVCKLNWKIEVYFGRA